VPIVNHAAWHQKTDFPFFDLPEETQAKEENQKLKAKSPFTLVGPMSKKTWI